MFVLFIDIRSQLLNLHKYLKADNRCLWGDSSFFISSEDFSWDKAATEVEFTGYQELAHIFG